MPAALLEALEGALAGLDRDITPEAEAALIRAALAQRPDLPRALVIATLRELVSAARRPLVRIVGGTQALARDRFGASARFRSAASAETALAELAPGEIAVMPLAGSAWWGRLLARPDLAVVEDFGGPAGSVKALAVAVHRPEPAGHARTWWVTDTSQSADRVEAALGEAGLAAWAVSEAGGLKLFALAGYVQADDSRLAGAPGRLSGVIGVAPQLTA